MNQISLKEGGMSPLSWQLLENKSLITFSLLEASQKMDAESLFQKKIVVKKDIFYLMRLNTCNT